MSTSSTASRTATRLTPRARLQLAAVTAALWGLLLTSACLSPDSRNYGTHEQLGLPPCTFASLFHMRCPSCGMTTAWSHATHGRVHAALRAHGTGTLLAAAAFLMGGWTLVEAAAGRRARPAQLRLYAALTGGAFVTLALIEWVWRVTQK